MTRDRGGLKAAALLASVIALAGACATGGSHSAPTTTTTPATTIDPSLISYLRSIEGNLASSLSGPLQDYQAKVADAQSAAAQYGQSQSNAAQATSAAEQQATATCQQQGYGDAACGQAIQNEGQSATSGFSSEIANGGQVAQRALQDLAAERSDLQAIGNAYLVAATSFAALRFAPAAQSDASRVETALTNLATAAQNSASAGINATALQQGFNNLQAALNNYRVALAALHADLGIPYP